MVLFDRGHVSTEEPFQRLVNQGMILGETEFTGYQDSAGSWVSAEQVRRGPEGQLIDIRQGSPVRERKVELDDVSKRDAGFVLTENEQIRVESRAYKMSKSRGNVVNPDQIVHDYGADALRLYEMFMGPLEATKPWSMAGVNGVRNFLDRVWRMIVDSQPDRPTLCPEVQDRPLSDAQTRMLHRTIMEVTHDLERLEFNTAIARMMEFVNFFTKESVRPRHAMEPFVLLLAPFAPHIGEELWQILGHEATLAYEPWPAYDEALTREEIIEVPVQIGKKVRARVEVPADATREQMEAAARADAKVAALLAGKTVVKSIVVPGRLVNFVVK
jgi:leucyl-tRNA synthetase